MLLHILAALRDEPNPRDNHVHTKRVNKEDVLCSWKVDGMHKMNRRKLIDQVNANTGLNLSYR